MIKVARDATCATVFAKWKEEELHRKKQLHKGPQKKVQNKEVSAEIVRQKLEEYLSIAMDDAQKNVVIKELYWKCRRSFYRKFSRSQSHRYCPSQKA